MLYAEENFNPLLQYNAALELGGVVKMDLKMARSQALVTLELEPERVAKMVRSPALTMVYELEQGITVKTARKAQQRDVEEDYRPAVDPNPVRRVLPTQAPEKIHQAERMDTPVERMEDIPPD